MILLLKGVVTTVEYLVTFSQIFQFWLHFCKFPDKFFGCDRCNIRWWCFSIGCPGQGFIISNTIFLNLFELKYQLPSFVNVKQKIPHQMLLSQKLTVMFTLKICNFKFFLLDQQD
eukprot:TRINITY_DN5042_c0_g1_i1.p1 TRINITY_DN5042_c0_g1~~TRINITY_DN5042_c0_g1_i1.p1  ORF type:complete len:115 (+),score=4.30 TRINITY_DN5042_c0_g1_i1:1-345(+)